MDAGDHHNPQPGRCDHGRILIWWIGDPENTGIRRKQDQGGVSVGAGIYCQWQSIPAPVQGLPADETLHENQKAAVCGEIPCQCVHRPRRVCHRLSVDRLPGVRHGFHTGARHRFRKGEEDQHPDHVDRSWTGHPVPRQKDDQASEADLPLPEKRPVPGAVQTCAEQGTE